MAESDGAVTVDAERLMARLEALGRIGRGPDGRLVRLAASDADRAGRDLVAGWMREAGLRVEVDAVGNLFGLPEGEGDPVLIGSHIDTVIDAGIYDGCYGVIAGIEVVDALRRAGAAPAHPVAVAAFTNEEGVRYPPDMLGSLVHAGGLSPEAALATIGTDGSRLGEELERIGYAGPMRPGTVRPRAYLELHIEQGPVLDHHGERIGAVEGIQGISWQRIRIRGEANHAGTTPMAMRRDAGHAAACIAVFVRDLAQGSGGTTVGTVGEIAFAPNAINVIPGEAVMTVDLRDAYEERLQAAEAKLADYCATLASDLGLEIGRESLARFEPVAFDDGIVGLIEEAAAARGLPCRRMRSGAGHDAQMIARIAPAAMIFVPSIAGISHNPRERTAAADLAAGADLLAEVAARLAGLNRPAQGAAPEGRSPSQRMP